MEEVRLIMRERVPSIILGIFSPSYRYESKRLKNEPIPVIPPVSACHAFGLVDIGRVPINREMRNHLQYANSPLKSGGIERNNG